MIAKRQRNHESFVQSIMHPKPVTSTYVAHGIKYEPIALQEYEKFMFNRKTPVAVLKSGLVMSKGFPVLGVTPDAKIVDFGCSVCFGLAEVKCPHTKFHVTPLDACSHPTFFMEKISENKCRLEGPCILCSGSRTNGHHCGEVVVAPGIVTTSECHKDTSRL